MARLLLVDDDLETLAWMEVALRRAGHEAQSAGSVQHALSILDEWRPDLLISDVLMPELDGWALSRIAAQLHIPVLLVTVVRGEGEAVLRGCTGFIRKPLTPVDLREAVHRALGAGAERRTVLVVDDDPEMRLAIIAILGPSFDALGAENGQQALDLLEHRDVALMITDVRMPVMDGRELVRRVRRDPRWVDLPVLVQTSDVEAARLPEWTSLGVERVMTKDQFTDWLLMRIDQRLTETGVGVGAPVGP